VSRGLVLRDDEKLLTVSEAARVMGLHPDTLVRRTRRARNPIPCLFTPGGHRRIRLTVALQYAEGDDGSSD
jgi:excisionase family DNA binding protein